MIATRPLVRRQLTASAAIAVLLVVLAGLGISLGSYPISVQELLDWLMGRLTGFSATVINDWRLPRLLLALIGGASLGIAGALLQAATRNPLASPDLIGISGGAYLAVLIVTTVIRAGWEAALPAAVVGAALSTTAVFAFAWLTKANGQRFLLAGVALSALLTGLNNWLVRSASLDEAKSAATWGAGSLAAASWSELIGCGAILLSGSLLAALLRPQRLVYALGDTSSAALGLRVGLTRTTMIGIAVLLTASITAVAGPIGFLPLVAAPIARAIFRAELLLGAALIGAALLLASDLLAQHVLPGNLPAGLVTTVLGGGYLLSLLLKK